MKLGPLVKLLFRLTVLCVPLFVAFGYLEWRLRSVPSPAITKMEHKKTILAQRGPTVEIVVIGNSLGDAGLDPARFPCSAINLADDAQTLDIDAALLAKYLPHLTRLQVVVVPVSFFSFTSRLQDNGPMHWRLGFYKSIFDLDVAAPFSPLQWIEDSTVARYTPRGAVDLALRGFAPSPIRLATSASGWTPDPVKPGSTTVTQARRAAREHGAGAQRGYKSELTTALRSIVAGARAASVTPVILLMPLHSNYFATWSPEQVSTFRRSLSAVAEGQGAVIADYSQDPRFTDPDFADGNHLSAEGAQRFSRILGDEVLAPLVARGCGRHEVLAP